MKTRSFSKNVKIDPQEYVLQASPPSTIYKKSINIERTVFWWAKITKRSLSKNVKIDPQEYVIRTTPSTIYKNSKNIDRTLFWCAKMKTRTFSKNVKIDPQEYVYQGSPSLYYLQKLPKYRTNSVWMGENLNANFVEKWQNRHLEEMVSTKTPKT